MSYAPFRALASLVLACALAAPCWASAPQDLASFNDGLEQMHKYMEQERWDKARTALDKLMQEHAEQEYVLAKRVLLLEDAERIAFWEKNKKLELKSLIHGELKSWKEGATSRIDLMYEGMQSLADFEVGQYAVSHPLTFAGVHEIEIKGKSYPWGKPPRLWICYADETHYIASLGVPPSGGGSYYPARLYREENGASEELDEFDSVPVKTGEDYTVSVKVTASKITVKMNKKTVLDAKRNRGDGFGSFAFDRSLYEQGIESIRIKGEVTSSWSGGLIDAAMQGTRNRFEADYDPEDILPGWLVNAKVARESNVARRRYPAPSYGSAHRAWTQVPTAIERGRSRDALKWLQDLADDDIPGSHRAFLKCLLYEDLGRYDDALEACERVLISDDMYLPARMRQAWYVESNDEASGIELLEKVAEDFPNTDEAVVSFIEMLLYADRLTDARDWLNDFSERHPTSPGLAAAQSVLIKAEKGPVFSDPTSYSTENYEVVTDMDREICIDAAQQLERMYRAYKLYFRRVPAGKTERFKVFLFSGEAGFNRYAQDVLGGGHANAAGLYSPVVKQLLIWNLPDREEMFKTVQHEGFHQYLDRLMPRPPVWLNEGMASYFEHAGFKNGKWDEGQVDRGMVNVLRAKGLAPLRQFMRYNNSSFRAEGLEYRNYCQGWLFVHYLRNSDADNKKRFDRLVDALCDASNAHQAVADFMEAEDISALEKGMQAHLVSLYDQD